MEVPKLGYVETYQCGSCYGPSSFCFIVRHPDQYPAISFSTMAEAQQFLDKLNVPNPSTES